MFDFFLDFVSYTFIFTFGLIIGSFLNCVIYRLKTEENIVSSRSHCVKCGHKLDWKDLIPVFSFLFLKGKCRYCSKKISWQYPLVELATGLIFVFILWRSLSLGGCFYSNLLLAFYHLFLISLLIIIFVYDLKHYLIPDKIIYLAIFLAFSWQAAGGLNINLFNPLISGFLAALFFGLIVFISKERWMGWGDVFLAFFMGLFLGFPNILLALFLAFTLGALIGITLILFGKKKMKSQIPFAPFLILSTFAALFWGERIIEWYLGLLIGM